MADAPFLDGKYTAFGRVREGLEASIAISEQEVQRRFNGEVSQPVEPVAMENVELVTGGGS